MNNPTTPSIGKILGNDYLAITLAFTPIVLVALPLVVYVLPSALGTPTPALNPLALLGLAAVAIFCWAALAWRVSMVHDIFASGDVVDGVITQIWFFRQRGKCKLSYTYMGLAYTSASTLVKTEKTQRLTVGEKVTLMVDPQDPKRVFVRNLYL